MVGVFLKTGPKSPTKHAPNGLSTRTPSVGMYTNDGAESLVRMSVLMASYQVLVASVCWFIPRLICGFFIPWLFFVGFLFRG